MRVIRLEIPDDYDLAELEKIFVMTIDGKYVRLLTWIGAEWGGDNIYSSGLLTHYADKALKINRPFIKWSKDKGWHTDDPDAVWKNMEVQDDT